MANEAKTVNKLAQTTLERFASLDHSVVQVGTTAKKIPAANYAYRKALFVLNAEAAGTYVYLGNSDVTADETAATAGFKLDGGSTMFLTLDGSCQLYGRTSSGTTTVHVLELA